MKISIPDPWRCRFKLLAPLSTRAIPPLLLLGTLSDAHAQAAPQGQNTTDNSAGGLQEIVVTAQKRSETLTQVAASISAFDSGMLQERGITNFSDIQQQVPGVSFGPALGAAQISIRGVGLTINTGAGEPGVAVHLDGVYEARPVLSSLAQFDLERVEILRGPQGTLYGRNATGGAVNFISKSPTDKFEAYTKVGYGNYNEVNTEAVVSGPLVDGLKGRLGVTYTDRADPFMPNLLPGQNGFDQGHHFGARGKLSADLSEKAQVTFALSYLRQNENTGGFTSESPIVPEQIAANPIFQNTVNTFGPYNVAQTAPQLYREAYSPTMTVHWDLDPATLTSITGYTHITSRLTIDADGSGGNLETIFANFNSNQVTQEFDLSGATNKLDWVVGGFFLQEKYHAIEDVAIPNDAFLAIPLGGGSFFPLLIFPAGSQVIQHYTERRSSFANFADLTYKLTDSWSLKAGARYSIDNVKLTQTDGTATPAATSYQCVDQATEKTFTSFTPKGGLQYEPSSNTNVYLTVSRGYKSGGVNFGTCGDTYDPETVTSYEMGYKERLLDNRLTASTAIYYYDYRNLQVYQLRPVSTGGGSFIDNAPKARVRGAEADLAFSPDEHWSANIGAALLDATYLRYSNVDSSDLAGTLQNLAGHRITKSPRFTGNAGVQYKTSPLGGVGAFTLRGEVYNSSSQYYSEFNTPADREGGYTLFNAFLLLDTIGDRFQVRAYGKNLSDRRYFNFLTRSQFTGTPLVSYAPPRQYGIEVSARF
jgi:iron complex outermembrane receptor protein